MSTSTSSKPMDQQIVDVVKGLVMDGVRKANSGHPGGPMSSADFASVLYHEFLNYDPDDAGWFNRDRFVLSAGHESMLLYSLLHLAGFLELDDLENFRQLDSRTPGHPEHDDTPGAEATTGPHGQGFSMAVGMAVAEAFLKTRLGEDVMDHFTYVLASDGDFQEPVTIGTASLAGLWGLGKLVVFYDSNKVQLAGPTQLCDCCDYKKLFESLCWQVIEIDGHDRDAIRKAIAAGQADTRRPTLIIGHTIMAHGAATVEGDFNTHGAPLKPEEIAATKKKMGLPEDEFFYVPAEVKTAFQTRHGELRRMADAWREKVEERNCSKDGDGDFPEFWRLINTPRKDIELDWPVFETEGKIATRKAWGTCLDAIMNQLTNLVGGSADLDPSNQTANFRKAMRDFAPDDHAARNLPFGVREFPMAAIVNGLALHGGIVPFGATFLTFSDYCRNALRMSALQKLAPLFVFTHDSFYLGEDGPTHQPIEHVASLRLIPDLVDFRPADANETTLCLQAALAESGRPSLLFLTRQGLPVLDPAKYPNMVEGVKRGGYVLRDCAGTPELLLIATGSEVSLALAAADKFPDAKIRVVSMPSVRLFEDQPKAYRDEVLPPAAAKRMALEAGRPEGWYKYVGLDGRVLGIDHFGASAPAGELAEKYGFTVDNVTRMIKEIL